MPVTQTAGRANGHLINKLSRMGLDYHIFLPMVLRCARFGRESSANNNSYLFFVLHKLSSSPCRPHLPCLCHSRQLNVSQLLKKRVGLEDMRNAKEPVLLIFFYMRVAYGFESRFSRFRLWSRRYQDIADLIFYLFQILSRQNWINCNWPVQKKARFWARETASSFWSLLIHPFHLQYWSSTIQLHL